MKKMIVVLAAVAALAMAAASPASAGACRTVKCFNKQIVSLQSQLAQVTTALNCVQPVAVSRYPGYDYNGYAAATTAIDYTESGDQVSTWVLGIQPGSCGSPQTRSAAQSASESPSTAARDASPFRPFQAMPSMALETTKANPGGRR
jgi:hypothetical protein